MKQPTYLAAALMMVFGLTAIPVSAQSQTIIIINGAGAQPYYPQPYAYPYAQQQVIYDEPVPYAYSYYPSYAGGYYPSYGRGYYGNGYYRPRPYWGW